MPRSYWLPVIVTGLILSTYVQATPKKNTAPPSSNSVHSPVETGNSPPPISLTAIEGSANRIAKALEAKNTYESSAEEKQHARQNIEAQQKMADAAHAAVIVASIEASITFVGVFLVGWTLYHTRRAANEAKRAADAARDAVTLAKEAERGDRKQSERESRAYLIVEPAGINKVRSAEGGCVGHVIVRNVGRVPASDVYVVVRCVVLDGRNKFIWDDIPDSIRVRRSIQPGGSMRQGTDIFPSKEDVQNANHYTFVWGVAWYEDGYGERRRTNFCHRYHGASRFLGAFSELPIEYRPVVIEADKARYHEIGNDST